jgi:hypothetical protein
VDREHDKGKGGAAARDWARKAVALRLCSLEHVLDVSVRLEAVGWLGQQGALSARRVLEKTTGQGGVHVQRVCDTGSSVQVSE